MQPYTLRQSRPRERRSEEGYYRHPVTKKRTNFHVFQCAGLKVVTTRCYLRGDHRDRNLPCAAMSHHHKWDKHDAGDFTDRCVHCKAWRLATLPKRYKNKCCAGGKVHSEAMQKKFNELQNERPEEIKELTMSKDYGLSKA
jgi:hypothetical protein